MNFHFRKKNIPSKMKSIAHIVVKCFPTFESQKISPHNFNQLAKKQHPFLNLVQLLLYNVRKQIKKLKPRRITKAKIDELAKSRHSGENRSPESFFYKFIKIEE